MKNYYISFGQIHRHEINNKVFDKDCIAVIVAIDESEARKKAFKAFDDKWCFIYNNLQDVKLEYYRRGLINLEEV